MSILLFFTNLLLSITLAVFFASLIRSTQKTGYLLSVFLFFYADIVFVLELAGIFHSISKYFVFVFQIILTLLSIILWIVVKKPPLVHILWIDLKDVLKGLKLIYRFPELVLLIITICFVYIYRLKMVLVLQQSNPDSLTYHLARIGYWLQYNSFAPWPTTNLRQTTFPMNAELGILWTILWWGTDQLAGFVQWIQIPVIILGIYGLVRTLGYSRLQGVLTSFLWATLTQTLVQSSTTQNDLVVTSFWVTSIFFFFSALRTKSYDQFYLSALAFGLAIGTKNTSLIFLVGFTIGMFIVFWIYRKQKEIFMAFMKWGIACVFCFLVFGAYIYLQNTVAFGHPLGPRDFYASRIGVNNENNYFNIHLSRLRDNLGRYIYQMVDFSPLPLNLAIRLNPIKERVFGPIFMMLGIKVDNPETIGRNEFDLDYINGISEASNWYGPLLIFLLLSILYQGYIGVKQSDALRIMLAVCAISFLLAHSFLQAWTPGKGRYYLIPVSVSFPLIACFLVSSRIKERLILVFIVLLGITTSLNITLGNETPAAISWKDAISFKRKAPSWNSDINYRIVSEIVPLNASIGADGVIGMKDYTLFGEYFTRRVTRGITEAAIAPHSNTDKFKQAFLDSEYLYTFRDVSSTTQNIVSNNFELLIKTNVASLWQHKYLRSFAVCDTNIWPFTNLYSITSSLGDSVCPQFPLILGAKTRISGKSLVPIIGPKLGDALESQLLVRRETNFALKILVNPNIQDVKHVLVLSISNSKGKGDEYLLSFDKTQTVGVHLTLYPDTYTINLRLAEDNSPSLVKVEKILIDIP